MSLFSAENIEGISESFEDLALNQVIESFIIDEVSKMDDEDVKSWCESDECKALEEANVLKKSTAMRLSKQDDFKRREKIAAYALARQANDPLYTKLIKSRAMWRSYSDKILAKYGSKANRLAKKGQNTYMHDYKKNVEAGKIKGQQKLSGVK
jgi:hypothetical protein